jgi:hypothetical protein
LSVLSVVNDLDLNLDVANLQDGIAVLLSKPTAQVAKIVRNCTKDGINRFLLFWILELDHPPKLPLPKWLTNAAKLPYSYVFLDDRRGTIYQVIENVPKGGLWGKNLKQNTLSRFITILGVDLFGHLPSELIVEITQSLGGLDLFSLRLCNKRLSQIITRETIADTYKKKVDCHISKMLGPIDGKIRDFVKANNCGYTGSSIVQAVLSETYCDSDLDIIVPLSNGDNIKELCAELNVELQVKLDHGYETVDILNLDTNAPSDGGLFEYEDTGRLVSGVYYIEYNGIRIEFITSTTNPYQHIKNYDLSIVRNVLMGDRLYFEDLPGILRKEMHSCHPNINYQSRCVKYIKRGFKLKEISSEADLKTLNEIT